MSDEDFESISTPVPKSIQVVEVAPQPGAGLKAKVLTDDDGRTRRVRIDGQISKPLGRPPGARNKPKPGEEPDRGPVSSPTRLISPPPRQPRPSDKIDKSEADKAAREAKQFSIEAKLTGEISEDLLAAVIAMTGAPASVFFRDGRAPVRFTPNEKLTPIGQAFSIPNDVAHYWAKVIVAFGDTPTGKSMTSSFETGNAGLAIAGLMAVAATIRWGQQVKGGMDMLKEMAEQAAQQQTNAENANAT